MTEKEFIAKIQQLKEIKPSQDWVVLTKNQILGEAFQKNFSWHWHIFPRFFFLKPVRVSASIFAALVFFGAFGFAQNSLPGDFLFSVKRAGENGQMAFVSDENKLNAQLELANKRLEELNRIAKANQPKKIATAIKEFKASTAKAVENLDKVNLEENPQLAKDIVAQIQRIETGKKEMATLGVVIGDDEELNSIDIIDIKMTKELVTRVINDLGKSTLTDNQQEILKVAKENFEKGDYSAALIDIWKMTQK